MQGDGLLQQKMLTGLKGSTSQLEARCRRCGNHNAFDCRIRKQSVPVAVSLQPMHGRGGIQPLLTWVPEGDRLQIGSCGKRR